MFYYIHTLTFAVYEAYESNSFLLLLKLKGKTTFYTLLFLSFMFKALVLTITFFNCLSFTSATFTETNYICYQYGLSTNFFTHKHFAFTNATEVLFYLYGQILNFKAVLLTNLKLYLRIANVFPVLKIW